MLVKSEGKINWNVTTNPQNNGEFNTLLYLNRKFPGMSVFFDIGTRTDDELTKLFLKCNSHARVHMFEPYKPFYQVLAKKIELLVPKFPNSKLVYNDVGLWSYQTDKEYYIDTQSVTERKIDTQSKIKLDSKISVTSIDEYCNKNKINHIDYIKIDTEGSELEIIKGGEKMLKNHTDFIQFEYGGTFKDTNISLADIYKWFGAGWYIYHISGTVLTYCSVPPSEETYLYSNWLATKNILH